MNNDYRCNFIFVLCISALVSGCVGDLIWNNDERYMYRGALDSGLPEIYNTYQFNFLRTYRVTHQWPREADFCGAYRKHPTLGVQDGKSGEFFNVSEIYEEGGKTWQGSSVGKPPADFDYVVRSIKRMYPEYAVETDRAGNRYKTDKVIGMKEKEVGRGSICNYVWSGLDQSFSLRIYRESLEDRVRYIEKRPGVTVKEKIGQNEWWSRRASYDSREKTSGGESWVTRIGTSDYVFIIQWFYGERSENRPEINAKFQAALRHLLESVRIESLK